MMRNNNLTTSTTSATSNFVNYAPKPILTFGQLSTYRKLTEESLPSYSSLIPPKTFLNISNGNTGKFVSDSIKKVIFNEPCTIVLWKDSTKTVVKCNEGDTYNKEAGLSACIIKKLCGNKGSFNDIFREFCRE